MAARMRNARTAGLFQKERTAKGARQPSIRTHYLFNLVSRFWDWDEAAKAMNHRNSPYKARLIAWLMRCSSSFHWLPYLAASALGGWMQNQAAISLNAPVTLFVTVSPNSFICSLSVFHCVCMKSV